MIIYINVTHLHHYYFKHNHSYTDFLVKLSIVTQTMRYGCQHYNSSATESAYLMDTVSDKTFCPRALPLARSNRILDLLVNQTVRPVATLDGSQFRLTD